MCTTAGNLLDGVIILGKEAEAPAPSSALVLGREARISDVTQNGHKRVNRRRKMGTMYVLHILNPCMVDVVRCIKVENEENFRSWYQTANHTKTSNPTLHGTKE